MTPTEKVTDLFAGAAVVSPWWLPSLHIWSDVAASTLPFLGGLWIIVQVFVKIHTTYFRKPK